MFTIIYAHLHSIMQLVVLLVYCQFALARRQRSVLCGLRVMLLSVPASLTAQR